MYRLSMSHHHTKSAGDQALMIAPLFQTAEAEDHKSSEFRVDESRAFAPDHININTAEDIAINVYRSVLVCDSFNSVPWKKMLFMRPRMREGIEQKLFPYR
jgi:hypothetical protein